MMALLNVSAIDPLKMFFGHLSKIPSRYQPRASAFVSKVNIQFQRGNYLVKTISTTAELEEVLQLRYEIFHREFQGKVMPYGIDWETLDPIADHLVIMDKEKNAIVGTYRIIATTFSDVFYSQSEFQMDPLLKLNGEKLELSRACIHKDYRNGAVMGLLWRGVAKYIAAIGAEYIFGCASVKTMNPKSILEISSQLESRGVALHDYEILPTPEYFRRSGRRISLRKDESHIPALFEAYLKAGAKISLTPAWDYDFNCVDYFTLLKVEDMAGAFQRKYRE
jgi:putative hemolysin